MTDLQGVTSTSRADRRARPIVVGLGASAGGIKTLKEFFTHVAPDSGIAYVVILHLSPDYESKLAEVLQVTARIPVTQVTTAVEIEPDHVYVVPQNKALDIRGTRLEVSDMTRLEQRRSPVDLFFRALGDAHGSRSVCVVLSGTGPNGSAGLKRVKEYGGLALAQDPNEAEYQDMPRNAIATGLVDLVLPVAQMPARIAAFERHLRTDVTEGTTAAALESPEALRDILALVRVRTGHDFANYKDATLQRRIQRRMNVHALTTLPSYAQFIREEPNEALLLMRELLISVTSFFRDADAFTVLEQRVIPRLFSNKQPNDQVRVWIAGCATGEEAYSIAMLLDEHARRLPMRPAIQVFATDLDEQAIAIAREGLYSEADVADLSEERLQRFFVREAAGFRVRRDLRELLLFAHHNVIRDPPFSHLDLISCRNLLIYLTRSVQERLVEIFHFALRPGGYLFLGTSETPEGTNDLFFRAEPLVHIYESRSVTSRLALPQSRDTSFLPPRTQAKTADPRGLDRIAPSDLHLRLLEQYAAPSLVISEDYSVIHVSERATRYLQVVPGEPSRELFRLIRPELRTGLRSALHQAAKERTTVDVQGLHAGGADGGEIVNVTVRPVLREGEPLQGFFLVLFEPANGDGSGGDGSGRERARAAAPVDHHVEDELEAVKAQLRATIEQYETQAEEAKAGNEELQAMNEELRSAAEELETSKEELQSVNEELTTVNQELKIKIEELSLTNNDFQNLMSATDIGSIFLDRALRVKLSTPKARVIFNLLETDIGRPLSDITNTLRDGDIHAEVKSVLDQLQNVEREVETEDGHWHLMRVLPYRTTDNRIDGVVVTFQDITARRNAEQDVRRSEERLRLLIESAIDYAIFTLDERGAIDSWNPGAERMFGYHANDIIGQHFGLLFIPEDRAARVPERELTHARTHRRAADERYHMRKSGTRFYCSGVTTRLGDGGIGFVKIARDLTESEQAKSALERTHSDLERRVDLRTSELALEVRGHTAANKQVLDLLRRVVSTQEDERRRISHELHDDIGQQLTALRLALEREQTSASERDLSAALELTSSISREIDFIAWQLRPAVLDELGLAAALPRFVSTWSAHVDIPADCRVERYGAGMLTPEAEVTFYRILQEALHNIAKHARPTRADVVLTVTDGQVVLIVEDDGAGFDPVKSGQSNNGLGLAGMRERAALVNATVQVESEPGKGTSVYLRCAIASPHAAPER